MTGQGDGRRTGVAAIVSLALLTVIFLAVLKLDGRFVLFVRSLHLPWLDRIGDAGTWLGGGAALVTFSVALFLIGLVWRRPAYREVGLWSLCAHGIAAVLVQTLKHVIARPRPRFMHAENGFLWDPSFASGLDSFPSGHATASFAVATVVASQFPGVGRFLYGAAGFIAISRIYRGSHFPSDVLVGIVIGHLAGAIVSHPLVCWRQAVLRSLTAMTPWLVAVFGLFWTSVQTPASRGVLLGMLIVGTSIAGTGLTIRVLGRVTRTNRSYAWRRLANGLIMVGIASFTGSVLVIVLVVAAWAVQWHVRLQDEERTPGHGTTQTVLQAAAAEVPTLAVMVLIGYAVSQLRGIVPLVPA